MYDVGGGQLQIFDARGFRGWGADWQVVLNILHKCLLTRVKVHPPPSPPCFASAGSESGWRDG